MEGQFSIILLTLIVLGLVIYLNIRSIKKRKGWKDNINLRINALDENIKSTDIIILKATLIELDKILEFTLKKSKFIGKNTGEMLKNANKYFDKDTYNNLWEAHKYRNKLVHEMDFVGSTKLIQVHYSNMKKAIKKITK